MDECKFSLCHLWKTEKGTQTNDQIVESRPLKFTLAICGSFSSACVVLQSLVTNRI